MRFAFTDEQLLFRDAVRALLEKECPPEAVRAAWDRPGPFGASLAAAPVAAWASLTEMGVVGLAVPEAYGGMGMNELDMVLLLEESGRVALPAPLVETTAVAAPLFAALVEDQPEPELLAGWLSSLATGELVVAAALDGSDLFAFSDVADLFLVRDKHQILAITRAATKLTAQASVDGSRQLATLEWKRGDAVVLADDDRADDLLTRTFDRGVLGTAAQLLGVADQLLATTVDYVKEREQFGVPIGSFQAIKHHLADALVALEFARPVVYRAAYSMATADPSATRDVSMAKAYASDAAIMVARHALQCHGAIGYTVEYDLHMWLKRAWSLAASWGDAAHHRAKVADAILGSHP